MSATAKLDTAMIKVMQAVKYVKKRGENKQQGYKFAGAEDLINAIRGEALKHGVRVSISYVDVVDLPEGETKAGSKMYRLRVKAEVRLSCEDESQVCIFYGEGADSGDKALPKAKTMCLKSAIRQLFLIETGDHDADKVAPEEKDTNTQRIEALPKDILAGFKWVKEKYFKGTHSATYRTGVISVLDSCGDDLDKIRKYLSEKGWQGTAELSDVAKDDKMPGVQ